MGEKVGIYNGDTYSKYNYEYPLVNIQKELLKMAIEIVDLPIHSWLTYGPNGDFPVRKL